MRGAIGLRRSWSLAPFWPGYRGVANIEALTDAELSPPVAVAFECVRASAVACCSEGDATTGADWKASPSDVCAGRRSAGASGGSTVTPRLMGLSRGVASVVAD